jgi:hypothetical protein
LDGAILRIALRALLGKTLLRTGSVGIDMRETRVFEHNLASRNFDELIMGHDAVDPRSRPSAYDVDDH